MTGDHPSWSAISLKLLCNFIEITLRHGYSPVNLLHIFRTLFPKNTSWWLLLNRVAQQNIFGCISKHMKKDRTWSLWRSTIIFIIFWDFLMFYQVFLSPQVKLCAIVTYKHGIYELHFDFPNDLKLRILGN